MAKVFIWAGGLVIIVAAGATLWWGGFFDQMLAGLGMGQTQQEETSNTPYAQQSALPTASNDASDQALNQDAAALDAQINAYGEASTALDQSLSDQPVPQEY